MTDTTGDTALEHRVVFLPQTAAEGAVATQVLAAAGFHAVTCGSIEQFCATVEEGAGALLLADDALVGGNCLRLSALIDHQPAWSDIPLIVLTARRAEPSASWRTVAGLPWISTAMLLDRPMRTETLIQAVRVALRARDRQYQLRSFIAEREDLLMQRDVLLREVHHRVKNNLQMMQSLIRLTARRASPDASPLFGELIGRVAAIGQLHNQLYASNNFTSVDAAAYLSEIADQLETAFAARDRRVRVVKRLEPMPVNLDTALPLGLIMTELFSNALRYAFPGEAGGEICVGLAAHDRDHELTVWDDGVGLPPASAGAASTGLQLVQALAKQMGGSFTLDGDQGVRGTVRFPAGGAHG